MSSNHNFNTTINTAIQMLNTGEKERAIKYLTHYCETEPNNPEIPRNIAIFLQKNKMPFKAEIFYHYSLLIDGKQASIFFNLGVIYQSINKIKKAINSYLQATTISPNYARAFANLAYLYHEINNIKKCEEACNTAIKLDPNNPQIKHMASALGIFPPPDTADQQYIKNIYNDYAKDYDQHLSLTLKSNVPELIHNSTIKHINTQCSNLKLLDLGCGTGNCGILFKKVTQKMTGIDLSNEMINKAREKKCYSDLHTAEINEYLCNNKVLFDITISSDVLIYVGDLLSIFKGVHKSLNKNGLFAFSVETSENSESDFILSHTGRYKHNLNYITKISKACNFTILSSEKAILRKQNNKNVVGQVCVIKKY